MSKQRWLVWLFFLITVYFCLFHKLDKSTVRTWDESLFALRATYMADNNAYMFNFNDLHPALPNHRNTKMPLLTGVQALSFKVFGMSELALRIPMVLLLTCILLFFIYYARSELDDEYLGIGTSIILISSGGILYDHMARYGDHDVVFGGLLFISLLFFYSFYTTKKTRYLFLFTFFTFLGFLTKSILAFQFILGIIIFLASQGKLVEHLKNKWIYISAAGLIGGVILTFLLFEWGEPGFFKRTWEYELGGRYSKSIEGHQGTFFYFLDEWVNKYFIRLILVVPGILYAMDKSKDKRHRDFFKLMLCSFGSAYLIFGMSQTKTFWYAAPMYFPLSVMAWYGVKYIIEKAKENGERLTKVLSYVGLSAIILIPIFIGINNNLFTLNLERDEQYGFFIKDIITKNIPDKTFSIVDSNFGTSPYFYTHKYNKEGYNISFKRESPFTAGEYIMTCLSKDQKPIFEKFETETLAYFDNCKFIKIIKPKDE